MIKNGDCIVIGVSGGADSVSLLVHLCSLRESYNLNLIAVHINHSIRGEEAERDEEFVKKLCDNLGVKCLVYQRDIPSIAKKNKISEELAGRNERYRIFYEVLEKFQGDKIAVAHNQNDSVETVLIKMSRGCSLNGLKGISPVNGCIIRPLINISRKNIENYLNEKSISYVNDSTNTENIYTRNIIRNCIIPYFEKINPGFINTVTSNSANISCDDDFIESYASKYYGECVSVSNKSVIVDLANHNDLHDSVKKRIILYAYSIIKGNKCDIEQKHINILLNATGTGKKYDINGDIFAELSYGKIRFCKKSNIVSEDYEIIITDFNKSYLVADKCIKFNLIDNTDIRDKESIYINYDCLGGKNIIIRNRRNGDKFIPSGMQGYKKLKNYYIDIKLEKNLRNSTPILCADNEIAAVLGYRVDDRYKVNKETNKILKITISGGTDEK